MNVDEVKTIADKFAVVIDSINRLLFLGSLIAVYVMLFPRLYKIEKATTTTATQVEQLNTKYDALDEVIRKNMSPEQWQATKKILQQ